MDKDSPEFAEAKEKHLKPRMTNGFWRWTGFGDKTLWNVLELLIVPAVLAVGAFYLENQASERQQKIADERYKQEQKIAGDRYQQDALQKYFDQMTQLLLEKKLRQQDSEAQTIARARTLSTLGELDENRKGLLLKFLNEANLISRKEVAVKLSDADLSGANLSGAELGSSKLMETIDKLNSVNSVLTQLNSLNNIMNNMITQPNLQVDIPQVDIPQVDLGAVNLSDVNFQGANFQGANLRGADLNRANFQGANLRGADLKRANLQGANLQGADFKNADLKEVDLGPDVITKLPTLLQGVRNLTPRQVNAAKNWKLAKYDPDFRKQLGLPLEITVTPGSSKSNP